MYSFHGADVKGVVAIKDLSLAVWGIFLVWRDFAGIPVGRPLLEPNKLVSST